MDEPMLKQIGNFFKRELSPIYKNHFFQNYQNIFHIVQIQFGSQVHMNQSFEKICQNVKK
jgi:hypothetical protein